MVVGNNQVHNAEGFDGNGNYCNANYDESGLGVLDHSLQNFDYMKITWGGATFDLGPAPNHYSQSNNRNVGILAMTLVQGSLIGESLPPLFRHFCETSENWPLRWLGGIFVETLRIRSVHGQASAHFDSH